MLSLEDGTSLSLEPFQRQMLAEFFGGATETLILIPKKNGKSTLLAALALHHLITTPDAECVIAAASRDQAEILFGQAAGFVRRSPGLQLRVRFTRRELRSLRDSGRVRVLASDVDTADGVIPTLALVDELHRHKSADLYGVFRDGLGPRNGRLITISTAGHDVYSPLGVMRQAAYDLPGLHRNGVYRRAVSADGAFVMLEWALGPDDDRDDMVLVKQANPASWQTEEALRRRRDSPSMTAWQWARFGCGVWTLGEECWLPDGAWAKCLESGVGIPPGARVVLGIDIGTRKDSSAVVRVWERDDGRVVVEADVFTPRGDGTALEIVGLEEAIREHAEVYEVVAVAYDKWQFERSAQEFSDRGLNMTPERLVPATQRLHEAIVTAKIAHAGDPVLAAHVNAGALKPHERGDRLVKGKSRRPIDALMALAIAFTEVGMPVPEVGVAFW